MENKKDWGHWKKKEECDCCIEIKDSIVVIICGDIDHKKLKESLQTFVEIKGNTTVVNQEDD
jgi:hypothetical protein